LLRALDALWFSPSHICTTTLADLVHRYRYRYSATKGPLDRRAILAEIVDCIVRQSGRFLKRNSDSGEWFSVSKEDAMNKTARAMQYRGRQLVQGAIAGRANNSHERPSGGSMHGHDSPLSRFVTHPPHCIPEDTGTPHAGWIPHAALLAPDVLLEQYYSACLASRHRMQNEPLCRQVSLDKREDPGIHPDVCSPPTHHVAMREDVPHQPAIRPHVYSTPTGHCHRHQISSSDNDWGYEADVTNSIQKEILTVCKVQSNRYDGTSPVKAFSCPNDDCHVDLPVHDLSAMLDESTLGSSQCGLDEDDWCATSLGSFDSEDELDQLHFAADMEW
jgi:hypothetical protein